MTPKPATLRQWKKRFVEERVREGMQKEEAIALWESEEDKSALKDRYRRSRKRDKSVTKSPQRKRRSVTLEAVTESETVTPKPVTEPQSVTQKKCHAVTEKANATKYITQENQVDRAGSVTDVTPETVIDSESVTLKSVTDVTPETVIDSESVTPETVTEPPRYKAPREQLRVGESNVLRLPRIFIKNKEEIENMKNLETVNDLSRKNINHQNLDKESQYKAIGGFILLAICTYLMIVQTLPLYESTKWGSPLLAAVGSVFMSIVFATWLKARPSALSIAICICFIAYEFFAILHMSPKSESIIIAESSEELEEKDLKLQNLKRDMKIEQESYLKKYNSYAKEGGENHNDLKYYKNHVLPAKEIKSEAEKAVYERQSELGIKANTGHNMTYTKIAYRTFLVAALMFSMHFFLSMFQDFLQKNKEYFLSKSKESRRFRLV